MTQNNTNSPATTRATGNTTPKRPVATPRKSLPLSGPSVSSPSPITNPKPQPRRSLPVKQQPSPRSTLKIAANGRDTPMAGPSTPRSLTPKATTRPQQGIPSPARIPSPLRQSPSKPLTPKEPSLSSASWVADQPLGPNGFPEIFSEPTNWDDPITEEYWELRTETVNGVEDGDSPYAALETHYLRQITHYKNLLVRSQSASSSSLHDLHSQLHYLQKRYSELEAEHAKCGLADNAKRDEVEFEKRAVNCIRNDRAGALRGMDRDERVKLLGLVAEACHPSDINAQIAILEKYRRSRFDILSRTEEALQVRILGLLDVKDILKLRTISKGYRLITRNDSLWKMLCRQLEWRDWDGEAGLSHLESVPQGGWEDLCKSLWKRERNWNAGLAQKVFMLKGHTNYVTSLRLRGDVLISGSYDETIRMWHLPPLLTLTPSSIPQPLVMPAKSVSCLDFYPPEEVFVAGYHDIGRIQVWKKKVDEWQLLNTLSGHLHGIRAVALNEDYLVSAGADKALVIWSWRTGEKIVRFGQQTNICVGIQLINDYIVSVTVDGVIRTFSIRKREMLAQFKISDLGKNLGAGVKEKEWKLKLKDVGGGQGGVGMINWFEGQGKWMTCATREMIIRLSWDEIEETVPPTGPITGASTPATPSPAKGRIRTVSSSSRALPITTTPTKPPTHLRQRTTSGSTPTLATKRSAPSLASKAMSPSLSSPVSRTISPATKLTNISSPANPMTRSLSGTATPSPLRSKGIAEVGRSSSPVTQSSSPRKSVLSSRRISLTASTPVPEENRSKPTKVEGKKRIIPLLTKPPKILELVHAPDVEKGAIDARRTRVVTSTRFAARSGADRHLYVGVPRQSDSDQGEGTDMIPVSGAWRDKSEMLDLQTPGKNPMSLVLDREKFVYGCTDGSIVVVGFLGHEYTTETNHNVD
ncbi:hypothetical protein I302_102101 [Kwoniella bestiolae CBS 10118]|uniref:F-box domain-containing protein n=1 Tax=Kwoniella bestiolae CBS 10118 TaxID=1296100 RepID=A0A1B9GE33_9TREE|nr:hypothetical protein I302_00789 [Kwoniella bestiolae CBS 10118]OCF29289.1 hypothetical protein I302_00789 [Kwoniella bestiolae CBS 10118]